MGEFSKIEWTDHTFNPWIGCQKVSPGCDHCYAEAMMDHRYGRVKWGPHGERVRTAPANWRKPYQWNKAAKALGVRQRVFCASLADWLDNKAPDSWREELALVIEETPQLDWLLLTKRIENFEKRAPWHSNALPPNVWLGVTCEDQENYDRRWPLLRAIDARVRFISYEPAIGPLKIGHHTYVPHWLICGGESGSGARAMDAAWARSIRDECAYENVAFFMKQMTGKTPIPPDLLVRQFPVRDASATADSAKRVTPKSPSRLSPTASGMKRVEHHPNKLHDREAAVVAMKLAGRSNREIGVLLGIAEGTARSYWKRALAKGLVHAQRSSEGASPINPEAP